MSRDLDNNEAGVVITFLIMAGVCVTAYLLSNSCIFCADCGQQFHQVSK